MKSLAKFFLCCCAMWLCLTPIGCGPSGGGVVQETDEMTFDQMAEMAAKETELSEQAGDK